MRQVQDIEIAELKSQSDWKLLQESNRTFLRNNATNHLLRFPFPTTAAGVCGCCGRRQPFEVSARHGQIRPDGSVALALSETVVCPLCKISSRMRFACDMLFERPDISQGKVYLTERKTNLFAALKARVADLTGSEFLGADKVGGQLYDDVRHEDIHALTFASDTFDGVMCLDVLEHVNRPIVALQELYRILKPGGTAVVTFPFQYHLDVSLVRSEIGPEGQIVHREPAVFHGNPLGGGSLVFTDFGWDFIASVYAAFPRTVTFINYWSLYRCHFGIYRFALVLEKPPASPR